MEDPHGDLTKRALDELIASGPLSVAFQPIVDLTRGEVLGYEVLGRCGELEGPLAEAAAGGPAPLLDLAHAHGRLLALDRKWRTLAITEIARLGAAPDLSWFINVDPRVVEQPAYSPGFTEELVRRHRLEPSRFVLELTEAVGRDPDAIERVLEHYIRQGFRVALDDLGAEQQSFATLLRIQPSILKLDGRILQDIGDDRAPGRLLAALAEIARRNGTFLIAEGVETQAQLDTVTRAGIGGAQGFHLGRPAAQPTPPAQVTLVPRRDARKGRIHSIAASPDVLLELLDRLRRSAPELEPMLQHVTDAAARMLDGARTSLRLLDDSRTRLLVAARTGAALSGTAELEFRVGEGLSGWVTEHATPICVDDAEHDPRFVPKPGQTAPLGAFLGVPLLDAEGAIGVLAASSMTGVFAPVHVRWLQVVAGVAAPYLDLARMRRLAITDELTLALNRRALDSLLPQDDTRAVSVALFDIDHFKLINDRLGHAAGDDVLRAVPKLFAALIRRGDAVVRLGGDEFLLVLRGVNGASAQLIAERACSAISGSAIIGEPVTLSAGVAERAQGETREALLERVDRALYRAKAEGRNRAELAT